MDDADLLAYADERLDRDPDRRAAVERYMRESPAAAARVRDWRAQNVALAIQYGGRASEPVPYRLRHVLDGARRDRGFVPTRVAATIALVAATAAAGAGWVAGSMDSGTVRSYLVGERHAPVSAVTAALDRDNAFARQPALADWRGDAGPTLQLSFETPDLKGIGYTLVAYGLVDDGAQKSVRLEYAAAEGARLTLFLRPGHVAGEERVEVVERDGTVAARWQGTPLAVELIMPANGLDARTLARAVADSSARGPRTVGLASADEPVLRSVLTPPPVSGAVDRPDIQAIDIPAASGDPFVPERMTN